MTNSQQIPSPPQIRPPQIRLLGQLCNASAVSGDEGEVRNIILKELRPLADEIKVDALGNVLVKKRGQRKKCPRVMLAAHMDEIGFMITHDEGDGIFRFEVVGGLDQRFLAGKPVIVGRKHIPGVIGAKAIHLTSLSERKNSISLENLRIDVGISGNNKIKLGDRATFSPNFVQIGQGSDRSIRSKALDDRIGVATLIEVLKKAPSNIELLAAFTVQEEIGLRGANVAAYAFDPDLAIALDCTPAYDLPNWEVEEENAHYNTRLDAGPAIYISDRGTLSDPRLIRHLVESGDEAGIPYQYRQPGGGGTDAGAIHKARAGIPSVSVSVPGRYLHTPATLVRLSDWRNTVALIYTALHRLTPEILGEERK